MYWDPFHDILNITTANILSKLSCIEKHALARLR